MKLRFRFDRPQRIRLLLLGIALACVALIVVAIDRSGLAFNSSSSMPIGLYRITPLSRAVRDGDIVAICPPTIAAALASTRGYFSDVGNRPCAIPTSDLYPDGHTVALLKYAVARAGDRVNVTRACVAVNGRCIPNSASLERDSLGRPMPHWPSGTYRLQPGELWLYATNPLSFDSRYFGPGRERDVIGFAHAVLAF